MKTFRESLDESFLGRRINHLIHVPDHVNVNIKTISDESLGQHIRWHTHTNGIAKDQFGKDCIREREARKQRIVHIVPSTKRIEPATSNDRINAPIQKLVSDILDKLPLEIWTSNTTTFCDPAMGGGQFILEIVKRLREAGHDDNDKIDKNGKKILGIKNRVFGFETDEITVAQTEYRNEWKEFKNEKNPVGNFHVMSYNDVLDSNNKVLKNMKFDVVVGNPPYNAVAEGGGGRSGTIGDNTLYKKFTRKAFDLTKPGGHVAFVTLKGIIQELVKMNKQVDYIDYMTDSDYWKYNTLYFVARNEPRTTKHKINNPIIEKILGNNEFGVQVQSDSFMQMIRDRKISDDGDELAIVRLPGKEPLLRRKVDSDKVAYGPKFIWTTLESRKSYLATDEPTLASCTSYVSTRTLTDAKKLKLFVDNNEVFHAFNKLMKMTKHASGLKNIKKFDLAQIDTGFEVPKEWNLSKTECDDLRAKYLEQDNNENGLTKD